LVRVRTGTSTLPSASNDTSPTTSPSEVNRSHTNTDTGSSDRTSHITPLWQEPKASATPRANSLRWGTEARTTCRQVSYGSTVSRVPMAVRASVHDVALPYL